MELIDDTYVNNSNLWSCKYDPSLTNNMKLCGRVTEYNFLTKSLNDMEKIIKSKKKSNVEKDMLIIIHGNHGYGKSCLINKVLQDNNYNKYKIDYPRFKEYDNTEKILINYYKTQNLFDKTKKKVIFIDNISSSLSSTQKSSIISIIKKNKKLQCGPIILVCNNEHIKWVNDLKKKAYVLHVKPLSTKCYIRIINHVCKHEKLVINDEKTLNKVLSISQYDVRRLLNMLQDLKKTSDRIDLNILSIYSSNSKKKDINVDLYTLIRYLFVGYPGISSCLKYFECEKVILPLMINENYINYISKNETDQKKQIEYMKNISESLVLSDTIDSNVYSEQLWELQTSQGYFSCVYPSYMLDKIMKSKPKGKKTYYYTSFAIDLNKTSTKSINKKNIDKISKYTLNKTIYDIIYMNSIVKTMINNDDIQKCCEELLQDYEFSFDVIKSLLKIDKSDKNTIQVNKIKKKFALCGIN